MVDTLRCLCRAGRRVGGEGVRAGAVAPARYSCDCAEAGPAGEWAEWEHGRGVRVYGDGAVYRGRWAGGVRAGVGLLVWGREFFYGEHLFGCAGV